MDDLTLVGVHEDGEHLLLVDGSGNRHRLRVDEALRAAVRRDRARLGQLQIETENRLRPREIQARIRAGETAEEVAAAAGVPVEHVRRYEGPVLAEREFMAVQARDVRLRRTAGGSSGSGGATSPETLGEVVAERLAQREVDPEDVAWDAWRAEDGTWCLVLTFTAGSRQREARWTYNPTVRNVSALDDEARWLTEEEPSSNGAAGGQRRLSPVRDRVYDVEANGMARPATEDPAAADLLDTLRERRGRRSRPVAPDADAADVDPVREAIDSLMSRGELHRAEARRQETARDEERRAEARRSEPRRGDADSGAEPAPAESPGPAGSAGSAGRRPDPVPPQPISREEASRLAAPVAPAETSKPAARSGSRRNDDRARELRPQGPKEAVADPPPAHPARSRPQEARDGEVLVLPDPEATTVLPARADTPPEDATTQLPASRAKQQRPPEPPDRQEEAQLGAAAAGGAARRSSRKPRRASVPSWDDIVFGQRRD